MITETRSSLIRLSAGQVSSPLIPRYLISQRESSNRLRERSQLHEIGFEISISQFEESRILFSREYISQWTDTELIPNCRTCLDWTRRRYKTRYE